MLQRPAGLQPDSSLGVLVSQEETILSSRAETLDLTQLLTEGLAGLHHCGLKL